MQTPDDGQGHRQAPVQVRLSVTPQIVVLGVAVLQAVPRASLPVAIVTLAPGRFTYWLLKTSRNKGCSTAGALVTLADV